MDSIVSYKSDDEQDSDGEHKYRESNHHHSNASHSSGSSNRKTMKETHDKERHSPDRRRKESKAESSNSDRNTTSRFKSDKRDDWNRSRNDWDRSREDRDRTHDRRNDNRNRDDRRRDRHNDRPNRNRANRGRGERDRRHWRSRSSSRDRYANADSPSDKREKDRRRYSSQATSSQDKNSSGSSNRNSSSFPSQDTSYTPSKSSRDLDGPAECKDQHTNLAASTNDPPYQSAASATAVEQQPQQLKVPTETPPSSALPSYYNPNILNTSKYAEQAHKRKLIWGNKKSEDTASKWGQAKFAQDTDGKVASKFMRLMGIKDKPKSSGEDSTSVATSGSESINKQEEMFTSMEQQYEVARQVTHTMRGVGLGFGSQSRPY